VVEMKTDLMPVGKGGPRGSEEGPETHHQDSVHARCEQVAMELPEMDCLAYISRLRISAKPPGTHNIVHRLELDSSSRATRSDRLLHERRVHLVQVPQNV
jgi:Fe-S cluster assembly iron-binding protein IscA